MHVHVYFGLEDQFSYLPALLPASVKIMCQGYHLYVHCEHFNDTLLPLSSSPSRIYGTIQP